MHPMLNTAIKAARRAGAIINRASLDLDSVQVTQKSHNDFVTEIDKAAEAAIIDILLGAYPSHRILAEESGSSVNQHSESDSVWIIDPLDGTTNFIHGFPQYCVSIALEEGGVMTQAVVYDPNRNDLFTATKGAGAFLNDRRLRVSKRIRLAESLISIDSPVDDESLKQFFELFSMMNKSCAGLRRPGSGALNMAYVAAGRLDGFFEKGLKAWDMAAGSLLVTESGGLVGNFRGDSSYLKDQQVVCANPKVFAQMVNLLSPYA